MKFNNKFSICISWLIVKLNAEGQLDSPNIDDSVENLQKFLFFSDGNTF